MNNLPAVVFALLYIVFNYALYKKAIYPGLIRNYYDGYYDGHINSHEDFLKRMRLFISMIFGWLLVLGLWLAYLSTFLLVAMVGGDDVFSVVCLGMSVVSMFLSIVATGWPKPIGRFLLREK